jgi:outer membrane protein OmpA-like peptidoglycan-associated protein
MRKLVAALGLALAVLCGLPIGQAKAADAEVRYVITNGGFDVRGHGDVEYYPAGKHDGPKITWANSGDTAHMPAGTYSVLVEFSDGAAKKNIWLDNQIFAAGPVEKTVEIGMPITEVRYVITNGGFDVRGHADVNYFPPGQHDGPKITWADSGNSVRMPAGAYSVLVDFSDGAAKKQIWLDNQTFAAGTVEKTVEVNLPITEVRYTITNGGIDVRGHGEVDYYLPGPHDGPRITWAGSGDSARLPAGTYNVHVSFDDGDAHKQIWIDNQNFSGTLEKTVEVGVQIAEVSYVITNGGVDVGDKGEVRYFPPGPHDGPSITWAGSGKPVRVPAGTYNVHISFNDGDAHKEMWLDNQTFSGKVDKTVEVGLQLTDVRYIITNLGVDVGGKGEVRFYPSGPHDLGSITWTTSGKTVRLPQGTYNVRVQFTDGDAQKVIWFDNQAFAGAVEKTVEVGVHTTDVRYVVTNNGVDTGNNSRIDYFPAGRRDGGIDWTTSGKTVRLPEGTYNVRVQFTDGDAHKEMWFDNQVFSGTVEKTVEVAVRTTDVRYVVTNGGVDTGNKGRVDYFPAGRRDGGIDWTNSGKTVRLPEGSYNVRVEFTDGDAHKEMWFENQAFSGQVEKTVEIGQLVAEVHYLITNGGVDVGQKGQIHYFPAGKREGALNWTYSGGTLRLPEATYDLRVLFTDGLAHKELWVTNQVFAGKVDKTVELGITLAQLTVTVTQSGVDLGTRATVGYLDQSDSHDFGTVPSGQAAVVEAGTYDIHAWLGGTDAWLRKAAISGSPHLTIDLTPAKTDVMITAMRGGNPSPNATCGIYAPGNDGAPLHSAQSGAWHEGPPGTYDLGCSIDEAGVTLRGWVKNKALGPGKTEVTIDFPAAAPSNLALVAPASAPEQVVPDKGDFPYLPSVPGSKWGGGKTDSAPVYVQLPGAHQPDLVANGSIMKWYQAPGGMSGAAVLTLYHDALLKSGWTTIGEFRPADAGFTTHYGQNGRNIWAYIHVASDGYSISVADATISVGKLAADLVTNCHLALTGVLFDFDKSTLKPESDGVLQQVSAMMAGDPVLKLEVQGHTDAVGSDAYNQPLSDARARSVVVWLSQHGVAPTRLSARGYGKTRPVASNATDEGRARNRRVEIANLTCHAKG